MGIRKGDMMIEAMDMLKKIQDSQCSTHLEASAAALCIYWLEKMPENTQTAEGVARELQSRLKEITAARVQAVNLMMFLGIPPKEISIAVAGWMPPTVFLSADLRAEVLKDMEKWVLSLFNESADRQRKPLPEQTA